MTLYVGPADLGTYLGNPNIDTARATLMIQLATDLCSSIVDPLPDSAMGTVLAVAARAFNNVNSAAAAGIGTAHVSYGTTSGGSGVGGLFLSRSDKATLQRLAGKGGAFSIDNMPDDAAQGLAPWDQNVTWLNGVPLADNQW